MRIPAIYRLDDGEPPNRITESLVWIVDWVPSTDDPDPYIRPERIQDALEWFRHFPRGHLPPGWLYPGPGRESRRLHAVVIFANGRPDLVPAWQLEVLPWTTDDQTLERFRPPGGPGWTERHGARE